MEMETGREMVLDIEKKFDVGEWKGDMARKELGNGSCQIY